ncbi:MAG: glycosyltransferase [Alistipes sp.]|nr:glycosyltransferase [Alistipes sp.]
MKILQISNYLYPHIGGIEQTARDIANVFNKQSIEQKILCFNEDVNDRDFNCKRSQTVKDVIDGVEVIRCGCICKIASQSISYTFGRELKRLMNEFKPDIVIFHYPNPFQAMYLIKYFHKDFKLILYWHLDITKQKILRNFFYAQNNTLLRRADKIVATSPNYIDGSQFLSKYGEKCIVISPTINRNRLKGTRKSEELFQKIKKSNDNKTICFALGRHVKYKGLIYLIEASKYLDENFKIFIGGIGPLTEMLKRKAAKDKKIEFLGKLSNDELVAYYMACDILVFPSITKNEAFGISLAEGLYFGKPAVTFTIQGSGVNYVNLDNVTGIECPNRNSVAYANAIKRLSEDKQLYERYSNEAKYRVEQNFTEEIFEKKILDLITF